MASAKKQLFDVFYAGECASGHAQADVRVALGKLFKADEATLQKLFSGKRQLVKRSVDKATALAYQKAMQKVGARPIIAHAKESAEVPSPQSAPAPEDRSDSGLSLAPEGTDVLRADERAAPVAAEIAIDHLSASPIGERIVDPTPEVAPREAPDFELADVGADLDDGARKSPPPPPPHTDNITLAPAEHDLSDCAAPEDDEPTIALDHLDIADSGTDLLNEEERRRESASAPDTSHLGLTDDNNGV